MNRLKLGEQESPSREAMQKQMDAYMDWLLRKIKQHEQISEDASIFEIKQRLIDSNHSPPRAQMRD